MRIAWVYTFAHHWEEIKMDFILFMFSIPFLNDIEISLLTSGCYCVYILTLTILKMCTKMTKTYGIPFSRRNFVSWRKSSLIVEICTDILHRKTTIRALMTNFLEKESQSTKINQIYFELGTVVGTYKYTFFSTNFQNSTGDCQYFIVKQGEDASIIVSLHWFRK